MKHHGSMGLTQRFRLIRFRDAEGLGVEDLLEKTANDGHQIRPEMADRVVEDTVHRNKWTRRGIGRVMHQAFVGHAGGPYVPPEIVYGSTNNPFQGLFLAGDDAACSFFHRGLSVPPG